MKTTTRFGFIMLGASFAMIAGCAHTVPDELQNARMAYDHASSGVAVQLVPAEVHKAQVALAAAERSFRNDPDSYRTRDLSYVAQRKAQMATALGAIAANRRSGDAAKADYTNLQGEMLEKSKTALTDSKSDHEDTKADLSASEAELAQARVDLMLALAKLAAVREDDRGIIITIKDDVLFKSGKSSLLPQAENRLDQLAAALMTSDNRRVLVEGHTDSNGSNAYNKGLSQRRAEAVRGYLIKRGHPADTIVAMGMGEGIPVADNGTREGRAENRRVVIIIQNESVARGN